MIWPLLRWIRYQVFQIRERDTDFDLMGVLVDPEQRPGLEAVVESFRQGFNLTLADDDLATLTSRMTGAFDPTVRGFAHEGTGMCLTIFDFFGDQERVQRFLERAPKEYDALVKLGVGFGLARLPWVWGGREEYAKRFAPGSDGMIMNGFGFHEGVFKTEGEVHRCPIPRFSAPGLRCFDHGLGRALWFLCGASPRRIARSLAKIPAVRHQDLWAGLGTAACFAGRAYEPGPKYDEALAGMRDLAGEVNRPTFNLGIALAAMLQYRAKCYTPWVERACELMLNSNAAAAGEKADRIWDETLRDTSLHGIPYASYQRAGDTMIEAFRS